VQPTNVIQHPTEILKYQGRRLTGE